MKTPLLITLGMMIALEALARGTTYSDYEFTKQAELIVQGEVVECRANGPYKIKVVRVLKGKCTGDTLDLPFRYFYAQSAEQAALSLSKEETGVFFLRYTRNGDCDDIYKMQLIRMGGDTPKNRDRLPYSEGYEIFEGWLGAQKRGTERGLRAFGDSIMKTAEFLRTKDADTLAGFFASGKELRGIALDALSDNPDLFLANRKRFGDCMTQCLEDSDPHVRVRAAGLLKQFDYREATEALNSHTNSPDASFRESVLSTLKTFEMRTPKKGKTKAKSAGGKTNGKTTLRDDEGSKRTY